MDAIAKQVYEIVSEYEDENTRGHHDTFFAILNALPRLEDAGLIKINEEKNDE